MIEWTELDASGTAETIEGIPDEAENVAGWRKHQDVILVFSDDDRYWVLTESGAMINAIEEFDSRSTADERVRELKEKETA